jgi:hypothetical protein
MSYIKAALQIIELWANGAFDKGVTNTRPCVGRLQKCTLRAHVRQQQVLSTN